MGTAGIIVVLLSLFGALVAVAWQLSAMREENDTRQYPNCCRCDSEGVKEVIREMGREMSVASGLLTAAAFTEPPIKETDMVSRVLARLDNELSRDTVRRVINAEQEELKAMNFAECVAYTRHQRNQ